jgi:hypothetical protein
MSLCLKIHIVQPLLARGLQAKLAHIEQGIVTASPEDMVDEYPVSRSGWRLGDGV